MDILMSIKQVLDPKRDRDKIGGIRIIISKLFPWGVLSFTFFLIGLSSAQSQALYPAPTLSPPSSLEVKDTPNDGGGSLTISWKLSKDDKEVFGDIDGYEIFRATVEDSTFKLVGFVPDNESSFQDTIVKDDFQYRYGLRAKKKELYSPFVYSDFVSPKVNWFRSDRINIFLLMLIFSLTVLLYIRRARKGESLYIRKISGLDAVDEAIGRATEMGKSVLFIPGIMEIDEIQTIAGISILGKVAKITAVYDTPLIVPVLYPMVLATAQEVVKEAYLDVGKLDRYRPDMVRYVAGEQFAFAAAVNGIMLRDRPAANIFTGAFYAESLLLAETGHSTGAIQIAGTANPDQLPFFIAACDYVLIGEELYAASAYLSREPLMLGSLKGQDLMKIFLIICIVLGAIFETFQMGGGFFYKLFIEH
jgi:hypothetical protein